MRRSKNGSTPRQYAYAVKKLAGDGISKKDIALSVGYPPMTARNATGRIENTQGFRNAVMVLANESNNVALAILTEFKSRGVSEFSNKDLNGALNAIGAAWERFNKHRAPNGTHQPENPIKRAIFQKVENQTINVTASDAAASPEEKEEEEVKEEFEEEPGF